MSLSHTLSRTGNSLTVAPTGDVTFAENTAFRALIDDVLASRASSVTVDLSGVRMIDSAGLSLFVQLRNELARTGGSVALQSPNAAVQRVLDVVGFSKLFTVLR